MIFFFKESQLFELENTLKFERVGKSCLKKFDFTIEMRLVVSKDKHCPVSNLKALGFTSKINVPHHVALKFIIFTPPLALQQKTMHSTSKHFDSQLISI